MIQAVAMGCMKQVFVSCEVQFDAVVSSFYVYKYSSSS